MTAKVRKRIIPFREPRKFDPEAPLSLQVEALIGPWGMRALRAHWPISTRADGNGRRLSLSIPKTLKPGHRLELILGRPLALKLVGGLGPAKLELSLAASVKANARDDRMIDMLLAGQTPQQIAAQFGITPRQVRNIRALAMPANDNAYHEVA